MTILRRYIDDLSSKMRPLVKKTNLEFNERLSKKYNCNLFLKREDQQVVRSFKLRGALSKIITLSDSQRKKGIVCASAGNHAQGIALTTSKYDIPCNIFLPRDTPIQKIDRIKYFSGNKTEIILQGSNFNQCLDTALDFSNYNDKTFIHPYDDLDVIKGQATIASEIYEEINPDVIIGCIGGGGLMSGISMYSKLLSNSLLIGVEPDSCPSFNKSLQLNKLVNLPISDNFVDGATVSQMGTLTYDILKENLDESYTVHIGKICETMVDLYKNDGIIVEPAGALSLSILDNLPIDIIKGKNIVCIVSGGNNDLSRYPEVLERMYTYQGLKHYYIVQFVQKPGLLRKFINEILEQEDDIVRFEYIKKTNREFGDVLIGIQVNDKKKINTLNSKLEKSSFTYSILKPDSQIYSYLI